MKHYSTKRKKLKDLKDDPSDYELYKFFQNEHNPRIWCGLDTPGGDQPIDLPIAESTVE